MTAGPLDADRLRSLLAGEAGTPDDALAELAAYPAEVAAAGIDDRLASALAGTLERASRGEQRRAADVLAPLAASSAPLHAALAGALRAPRQRLRWGAAYTLGRASLAGPDAWPAVREALSLDDGDQRWAAAELACALARSHAEVAGELRRAARDASATLRKMALYCLRDLAAPRASEAGAQGELGDAHANGPDDTPALARAALADPDAGVRLAAVSTVAATRPACEAATAGAAALARVVATDHDPGVRRAAAAALGKLGVVRDDVLRALDDASASGDASLARAARNARRSLSAPGSSG